ncbi:unnamed protein product [Cunninghamella blakesleeana]
MKAFIENCVKESFQRTKLSPNTLSILSQNIYFITIGFRATLLIDYYLEEKQAKLLISKLKQNKGCQQLLLLQFTDRFTFLGHRTRLIEHYNNFHGYYVDIQGDQPILLERMPEDLQQFLKNQLDPFLFSKNNKESLFISFLPSFMISLTGWLLEYPIIYVCHQLNQEILDEWEPKKNCLGNIPLVWIRIDVDNNNNNNNNNHDHSTKHTNHSLLRFTYPSCILPEQHDQQQLFEQLKTKYSSRLIKPYELNIQQEIITLDRVAM